VSAAANVAETALVKPVLDQAWKTSCTKVEIWPDRIIADKAYDSDAIRRDARCLGVQLLAPHRRNRRAASRSNDGRCMRRYRNRWKIERVFAHASNYRRFITRYERLAVTMNAVVNAVCLLLALKHL
jgi:transposase